MTGFQKFRYNCDIQGCFNKTHRLDFDLFYDCLPGRISFSDIDGITEVNGHALVLEKKAIIGPLPTGQKIMFERLTVGRTITVLCFIAVDNKPESITHCALMFDGKWFDWRAGNVDTIRAVIRRWADWARHPTPEGFLTKHETTTLEAS